MPVHYFAGLWGLLAPAFFANGTDLRNTYGHSRRTGLFYGGGAEILGCQLTAAVCVTAWVCVTMIPYFWLMHKLRLFRVDPEIEKDGLDDSKHGGSAYPADIEGEKLVQLAPTFVNS